MRIMKIFVLFLAVLAFGFAYAQGGEVTAGTGQKLNMSEKIFDPTRDTAKDISDAITLATKQNKHILLDVGGNWCSWCHKLDTLFKTDAEVGKLLKKYVVVKVNFSPDNENKAVLANYPKIETGYPHIFVLDKSGKLIQDQDTGKLESGDHHDPAKVIEFLKKWS